LGAVIRSLAEASADEAELSALLDHALFGLGGVRRNPAVRRIDDERRPIRNLLSSLVPVLGRLFVPQLVFAIFFVVLISSLEVLAALPELVLGQDGLVAKLLRSLQGNAYLFVARPHTLQIGVSPRSLGNRSSAGCSGGFDAVCALSAGLHRERAH